MQNAGTRPVACCYGHRRENGEACFTEHGAVPDRSGVCGSAQLFTGRPGTHETVETGYRAAGNGHKQEWNDTG